MSKIFAIPYNGATELTQKVINADLGKYVFEFFGSDTKFASARVLGNPDKFIDDVKNIINSGFEFNYLFNSVNYEDYLINLDLILEHLKELEDIGVKTLTVSHPILVDIIKEKAYNFTICNSVNQSINSIEQIDLLVERGYDRIIVGEDILRDIKLIEKIRNHTKLPIEVMVNNCCMKNCLDRFSHGFMTGTKNPIIKTTDKYKLERFFVKNCRRQYIHNPKAFVVSSWIRPEDIERYINIGINYFKLSGRTFAADVIIQNLNIFASGHHNGNIFDYLPRFYAPSDRFGIEYMDNSKFADYFEHIFTDCNADINCKTCDKLITNILQ